MVLAMDEVELPNGTWVELPRSADDATLARLRPQLEALEQLVFLALIGSKVTDSGLSHVAGLVSLERLDLGETAVEGCGLEALAPLPVRNLAWATKGFELDTGLLPYEVVAQVFEARVPTAVLSGPTFAREVGAGLPSAMTIASRDDNYAHRLAESISTDTFRAYTSSDVAGVEVGGATKNVYAIGAGISDGLGFGANTRIALIARGLAEMTRLGLSLGGKQETFMGLAGMGDLVLTCTDDQSRNRRFGLALARDGRIVAVQWDSPAFKQGLTLGGHVVAVNGTTYTADVMRSAVRDAKGTTTAIISSPKSEIDRPRKSSRKSLEIFSGVRSIRCPRARAKRLGRSCSGLWSVTTRDANPGGARDADP